MLLKTLHLSIQTQPYTGVYEYFNTGVYELSNEIGSTIALNLAPEFYTISCSEGPGKLLEAAKDNEVIVFFYDTTFNLCDFFVSTSILCSNLIRWFHLLTWYSGTPSKNFQCGAQSVFFFFFAVRNKYPFIANAIMVTDRETAMQKAIQEQLPDCRKLFCSNHIQQDVKFWFRKKGIAHENTKLFSIC